jgi:hypothetical protein
MTGVWSPGCHYGDFGFSPGSVHVRSVVDELTLRQVFLSTCLLCQIEIRSSVTLCSLISSSQPQQVTLELRQNMSKLNKMKEFKSVRGIRS